MIKERYNFRAQEKKKRKKKQECKTIPQKSLFRSSQQEQQEKYLLELRAGVGTPLILRRRLLRTIKKWGDRNVKKHNKSKR